MNNTYVGLNQDTTASPSWAASCWMAGVFGFIPETEDCAGWDLGRMQMLMDKISAEWDKYANLPSRLPPELQQRHTEIYASAVTEARAKGWNPELGDDE